MKKLIKSMIFGLILASASITAAEAQFALPTDIGSSARVIRLGNVEGQSDLANNVFENPASLYRINRASVSMFTSTLMEDVTYRNLSGAMRLKKGVIGFGYMSSGVDQIMKVEQVDKDEFNELGYFGYRKAVAKLAYQYSLSRKIHLGVAGSYFLTDFDTVKGTGYNIDLGAVIHSKKAQFAFSINNALSGMSVRFTDSDKGEHSSQGKTEKMPFQGVASVKYKTKLVDLYAQIKTISGPGKNFITGFGVDYSPRFLPVFHISGGVKGHPVTRSINGVTEHIVKKSATIGLGLDLYGVSFDYAFEASEHIEFKSNHYFSVSYGF